MFNQTNVVLTALALCMALLGVASGEERRREPSGQPHGGGKQFRAHRDRVHEGEGAVPDSDVRRRISATALISEGTFLRQQSQSSRQQRRRAQSSCDESSPFSIISSDYPDAVGCYFQTTFETDTTFEIIYTPSGQPEVGQMWMHTDGVVGSVETVWWLSFVTATTEDGYVESSEDLCSSYQASAYYHPADVLSWQCGTDFTISEDEFSLACGGGCSDSSSSTVPEASPTPEPVVETPGPVSSQGSCEESSPFSISSSDYPEAEGCYYQTAFETDTNYEIIYTPSGQPEVGQMWIHSDGIEGYSDIIWWLSFVTAITEEGFVESSEDLCSSNQEAAFFHPADVLSWQCGTDFLVSTAEFSVTCDGGCSDSSSSSTVPGASPTPEPAAETPAPTETETLEPREVGTPQPTEASTLDAVPTITPESPEESSTPAPSAAGKIVSSSAPTAPTQAPMAGSRDLEITPSPAVTSSDAAAVPLPPSTPAPVEESEQQQEGSAGSPNYSAWSVFVTGSAGVLAAIALAASLVPTESSRQVRQGRGVDTAVPGSSVVSDGAGKEQTARLYA